MKQMHATVGMIFLGVSFSVNAGVRFSEQEPVKFGIPLTKVDAPAMQTVYEDGFRVEKARPTYRFDPREDGELILLQIDAGEEASQDNFVIRSQLEFRNSDINEISYLWRTDESGNVDAFTYCGMGAVGSKERVKRNKGAACFSLFRQSCEKVVAAEKSIQALSQAYEARIPFSTIIEDYPAVAPHLVSQSCGNAELRKSFPLLNEYCPKIANYLRSSLEALTDSDLHRKNLKLINQRYGKMSQEVTQKIDAWKMSDKKFAERWDWLTYSANLFSETEKHGDFEVMVDGNDTKAIYPSEGFFPNTQPKNEKEIFFMADKLLGHQFIFKACRGLLDEQAKQSLKESVAPSESAESPGKPGKRAE